MPADPTQVELNEAEKDCVGACGGADG